MSELEEVNDAEDTEESGESATAASIRDSSISYADWTTETLAGQLRKGNIQLSPVFQRRDAWRRERKSRFIESIILGVPVPQIVLAERAGKNRGSFIVIDGKQRLLTIEQFCVAKKGDGFALRGLKVLSELNGAQYSDLENEPKFNSYRNELDNQSIRTVVIKKWPNEEALYDIFLRLNTGSLPLSSQELRQALHPGKFNVELDKFAASCQSLRRILRIESADFRMRDVEIVLRYVSLRRNSALYGGNLKALLDKTTVDLNAEWEKNKYLVESLLGELTEALNTADKVWGPEAALRKWNGSQYESSVNRAIADVVLMSFSLSSELRRVALESPASVVELLKRLCLDPDFEPSVSGTTKSLTAFRTRFGAWWRGIAEVTNVNVPEFPIGGVG